MNNNTKKINVNYLVYNEILIGENNIFHLPFFFIPDPAIADT